MAFDWKNAATGTLYGGVLPGIAAGFMPGYGDPSKEANKYLNQIEGKVAPYYSPYIEAGGRVNPQLEAQYSKMISDPNSILKMLSEGYTQSPGYQFRLGQGENAISNAEAAGGMVGSQQHQQRAGDLAEKLATEDYENYLNKVLGIFGGGTKGLEGINERGYNASSSLADAIANILGTQAQYAYAGEAGRNQANAQDKSNFFSGLGALTSGISGLFG